MANQEPSDAALASVITQVSQSGQPARAPYNPQKQRRPTKQNSANKSDAPKVRSSSANVESAPSPIQERDLADAIPLPSTSKSTPDSSQEDYSTPTPPIVVSQLNGHEDADTQQSSIIKSEAATSTAPQAQLDGASVRSAPKKKKKRSGFLAFLAALGCISDAGHEADANDTDRSGERPNVLHRQQSKTRRKEGQDMTEKSAEHGQLSPTLPTATQFPNAQSNDLPMSSDSPSSHSRLGTPVSREETGNVMSAAVVNPGADPMNVTPVGTPRKKRSKASTRADDEEHSSASGSEAGDAPVGHESDEDDFIDEQDEEDRIIQAGGMGIPIGEDGLPHPLLDELSGIDLGRKCLVLDLDETLVHSSFKFMNHADFIVPVEIENTVHNVYVIKRPGVDEFLRRMGEIYEVVVFTASLAKYADPVLDHLDIHRVVRHRLFRESCYNHKGNYVKDLSQIGRPIPETIIIDNSPASYIFHPKNAVPVSSWFNDPHDTELTDMIGVLADLASVPDVRSVLDNFLYEP